MLHVSLINMPFVGISRPSLGLTQLKAVGEAALKDNVEINVLYLNIDFAEYFGEGLYASVCYAHQDVGLGDWFFRQAAFPELPDNSEVYFARYFADDTMEHEYLRRILTAKRAALPQYLDTLIDRYNLAAADIVGFTSTFTQNTAAFAMARAVKERQPLATTLMGGANCETIMGRTISQLVPHIDFVFSGSALVSFPLFLRHYVKGDLESCHTITGVFSKRNAARGAEPSQEAKRTTATVVERGMDSDIDTIVPLDYRAFLDKLSAEFPRIPPVLLFETSRGCWWGEKAHCTFCGLNGDSMAFRAMKPANAIAQMDLLFQYSDRCSYFECVDNIMPKHYVREVLPALKRPSHAQLFYEVKADFHYDDLAVLYRSGVRVIQPGIESLFTSTLRLMKKGVTALQNIVFLRDCRAIGILPVWNLLVGFPGESEEMYRKYFHDIPRLTHLFPPRGAFPISFDRFSPYHTRSGDYGLSLAPLEYYRLTYPFDEQSLMQLAFYFADRTPDATYLETMRRNLPALTQAVDAWTKLWYGSRQWSPYKSYLGPTLHCAEEQGSTVVCDSRSGSMLKHPLSETGKRILQSLTKPQTASGVAKDLNDLPRLDVDREIAGLYECGFVFQEGDHYVSLVHEKEPSTSLRWFPW